MKNKKRAYTLAEVIVTLAISIIVIAFISSLIFMVSGISKKTQYENTCQNEYKQANQIVSNFANAYSVDIYTVKNVVDNQVVITDGINDYSLNFEVQDSVLNATIKNYKTGEIDNVNQIFDKIVNIKFTAQDNIVLCEYIFDNYPTYTDIIKFGVS